MGRQKWGIPVVLILACTAFAADEPDFYVDYRVGWGGCYRPMEWTPVEITVRTTLDAPFDGVVQLTARQDDMTDLRITHPFVATKNVPVRLPLATKFAHGVESADVRLIDRGGWTRWAHDFDMYGYSGRVTALRPPDALIGLIGRSGFGILRLDRHGRSLADGESGEVFVRSRTARAAPWDWTGYEALDALVCYDADLSQMRREQQEAIAVWVSRGGRLLIVLGARRLPADSPIAAMVPAAFGEARAVTVDPSRFYALARRGGARTVTLRRPSEPDAPGWRSWSIGGERVLIDGPAGFGRVAVLAFDPAALGDYGASECAAFWANLLNEHLLGPTRADRTLDATPGEVSAAPAPAGWGGYYHDPPVWSEPTNDVLEHLLRIEELRPLSIWWVIGLLGLLAAVLGPMDYLVLKAIGRLPWTWITSAVVIAAFSVGAYYGVQAIRAGDLQVRAVTVLDTVQTPGGKPVSWRTTYSGIFAPRSDDYHLAGLNGRAWISALSPSRDQYGYGYGQQAGAFGSRLLPCAQVDGANLPRSVPINIWTMQCLLDEAPVEAPPLSVSWRVEGDGVRVRMVNHGEHDVTRAWMTLPASVSDRSAAINLGPVRAHEEVQCTRPLGAAVDVRSFPLPGARQDAVDSLGTRPRSRAIEGYLDAGAGVVEALVDGSVPYDVVDYEKKYRAQTVLRVVAFPDGATSE